MAGQPQESSSFQEKPLNRPEKANVVLIILFNCERKFRPQKIMKSFGALGDALSSSGLWIRLALEEIFSQQFRAGLSNLILQHKTRGIVVGMMSQNNNDFLS